ncbi:MAG: CBS domain-containing protein [Armatimonadetes bacterium]|nr:CBS domain-containing protein [Armatimonadota bacterium]
MSLESDLKGAMVSALDIHSSYLVVEKGSSVRSAVEQMRDEKTNCAIVTENRRPIGIFTDQDVVDRVLGYPETWDQPIEALMSPAPPTVRPETSALDAFKMLEKEQLRNLPVVNGQGEVLGNLDQQSIIHFLSDRYHIVYNQPPDPGRYVRTRHGA